VRLVDDDERRTVFDRTIAIDGTDGRQLDEVPIEVAFEPIARSRGRHLSLHLAALDGGGVDLWASSGPLAVEKRQLEYSADEPDSFQYAGQSVDGRVLFECCYDAKHFREVATIGELALHEHVEGCWQPHVVHDSFRAASPESARARVREPAFDPAQEVVIPSDAPVTDEDEPVSDDRRAVELVSRDATHVRYVVKALAPGWLVLDIPWYPGWHARIDGIEVPLVRANYAFCALPIGAGPRAVELEYAPKSFRIGAVSSLSSLGLVGLLAFAFRRGPRRDPRGS
jgi:hypothetical protein